jgi:hypothetical protein
VAANNSLFDRQAAMPRAIRQSLAGEATWLDSHRIVAASLEKQTRTTTHFSASSPSSAAYSATMVENEGS